MNIRPVGERVLVRRIEEMGPHMTPHGLHIPDSAEGAPVHRGIVIEIGDWPYIPALHRGEVVVYPSYCGMRTDDGIILSATEILGVEFEND